nr:class I SAM-dependent methyltransferase [Streptomyces fodineus]
MAYWLAARRPGGRVVAVDLDTRHLDAGRATNLEIQEADVTHEDYAPGTFDLVHARYLFCHLPDRDEMITRAAGWLSPGGWLIVEEPYDLPAVHSPRKGPRAPAHPPGGPHSPGQRPHHRHRPHRIRRTAQGLGIHRYPSTISAWGRRPWDTPA